MRTTMNFVNKGSNNRNITSMTSGADGELMSIFRTKKRYHNMDRLILIYDDETGHLRVGQGPKAEMESVSGVRVVNNVTDLPINGRIDTLYVCLGNNSMYVWNDAAKTWLSVGGASGSGAPSPAQGSVLVFNDRNSLPLIGAPNTLYATKHGESYIYDPASNKYIQLKNSSVDAYTKQESDNKFATKQDLLNAVNSLAGGGGSSSAKYSDVRDTFEVNNPSSSVSFQLTKKPEGEVSLYINGIHYVNTDIEKNYIYNPALNTLVWINTSEISGGFTLEDSIVCIEYKSAE